MTVVITKKVLILKLQSWDVKTQFVRKLQQQEKVAIMTKTSNYEKVIF